MSPDSIEQYRQAKMLDFNDWHPPLMSLSLALILQAGGNIGSLILLQCLLGVLGMRFLIVELIALYNGKRSYSTPSVLIIFSTLALSTPAMIYMVTFWKDSWMFIFMCWGIAFTLRLLRCCHGMSLKSVYLQMLSISFLWGLTVFVRHNAIVLFPVIGVFIVRCRGIIGARRAGICMVILIVLPVISSRLLRQLAGVKASSIRVSIMAGDIIGAIVANPLLKKDLQYTASMLMPNYETGYRYGDLGPIYWYDERIVDPGYADEDQERECVNREYSFLLKFHPILLGWVKVKGFWEMIHPAGAPYSYFQSTIIENPYGLRQAETLAGVRRLVSGAIWRIGHNRLLKWGVSLHLSWLLAAVVISVKSIYDYLALKKSARFGEVMIILIALSYYASYLLAATARDHRLMFPSTMLLQAMFVTRLYCFLWQKYTKSRALSICI
jgi:hypothetical protein